GIRDRNVTGVQTCALPICCWALITAPLWCRRGSRSLRSSPSVTRICGCLLWPICATKPVQSVGDFGWNNPHLRRFRISDLGEYLQVLIGQQICIWLVFMDSLKHCHNSLRFSICSENRSLCVAFSFKDRRLT